MTEDQLKALLGSTGSPVRIILMAAFLLLAKAGLFTWLTPENVHDRVNDIMDFLVVAAPAAYAIWSWVRDYRRKLAEEQAKKPEVIVATAAALPEVKLMVTTPEIAAKVDDPTVVVR